MGVIMYLIMFYRSLSEPNNISSFEFSCFFLLFFFFCQVSTVALHHKSKMLLCSAVTPLSMAEQSTSAMRGFYLLAHQRWSVSQMVKLRSGHHWTIPIQHLFADVCYYCLMCTTFGRVFAKIC